MDAANHKPISMAAEVTMLSRRTGVPESIIRLTIAKGRAAIAAEAEVIKARPDADGGEKKRLALMCSRRCWQLATPEGK